MLHIKRYFTARQLLLTSFLGDHEDGDEVYHGQTEELRLLRLLYVPGYKFS